MAKRLTPQQALRHSWLRTAAGEANVLQSNLVMERLRRFTDMTKLQGMLMNLIAKNLSTEGIDSLRDAFNSLVSTPCSTVLPAAASQHAPFSLVHAEVQLP